jgi:hypothetical protein
VVLAPPKVAVACPWTIASSVLVVAVPARPAEGDATAEVLGDGESDAEALGEGDAVAEGDADGDAESVGDGDGVSVGDGEGVSVGDGDNVAEGEGEGSVWAKLALPSIARWTVSRAESRTASAITRFRPTRAPNENCLRCVPLMSVTPHPRTASILYICPIRRSWTRPCAHCDGTIRSQPRVRTVWLQPRL